TTASQTTAPQTQHGDTPKGETTVDEQPDAPPSRLQRSTQRLTRRSRITRLEILVGLIVLGTAIGEGAANDWLAVALVDGRGAPAAIGALAYAGFNLTMAIGRFSGGVVIAHLGRATALRIAGGIGAGGILLLSLVPLTWTAFA